jgi:mRNA-degrading endonuclease RelE of RelBE toxin-antitoxin system
MRYSLVISEEAREQLRALPKPMRRNIGRRLDTLQNGLSGDVKRLTAREQKYRLRRDLPGAVPVGRLRHLCVCC